MAFERVFSGSFLAGVLWRTLLVALLLTALLQLLFHTQYYATALVVLICILLTTADLIRLTASESRAAERFLDALSASALETPVQRSAVPASLRAAFDRTLVRLQEDRHRHQLRDQYLQTLLDTVPASLIVLHNDGQISFVNRAAHRLLGEPASRLADLSRLGEEASRQLTALTTGTHRIVQLSSGNRLLASAAQFATPDAPPRRLIALQRLSGDLDAVELTAWDQMARLLAHEMMNSLTPIASLSQSLDGLVRAGERTADVTAALEAITRRSQGLLHFVERYRRIADLPEPHLQLEPLLPLVESVGRLVQPALEARAIALDVSVTPQDLAAPLDRELLEQALLNLLRNAADATADRPQPRIGLECRLQEGECVIDVIDNGPGLTPEQREQLFVPFFTTKPGGSGIGLSLARRIAQGHGGQLVLLDAAQGGCVFRLSLRVARSAEPIVARAE